MKETLTNIAGGIWFIGFAIYYIMDFIVTAGVAFAGNPGPFIVWIFAGPFFAAVWPIRVLFLVLT